MSEYESQIFLNLFFAIPVQYLDSSALEVTSTSLQGLLLTIDSYGLITRYTRGFAAVHY